MSVSATTPVALELNAANVRYAITAQKKSGVVLATKAHLIRSQKDAVSGLWTDAPDTPTTPASKDVTLPAMAEVDALVAQIPAILATFGMTDPFTDYKLSLASFLTAGVLDVKANVQVLRAVGPYTQEIPSLGAFLAGLPSDSTLPEIIGQLWANLDAAINTLNAAKGWL